jgi:hypothetical protein
MQDNLTAKQTGPDGLSQWAIFLPAISGFYSTFIGKQRYQHYVDPDRFPTNLTDMEQLNWLNSTKALFPYRWSLYSGGHANLDLSKLDPSEDMVRNREPESFVIGDSGGFQIAKGLWLGEWRDPTSQEVQKKLTDLTGKTSAKTNKKGKTTVIDLRGEYQKLIDAAEKKRSAVLNWLDNVADYGMGLDIPSWVIHDKKASDACGIQTIEEAIAATRYNNEYFIQHRRGVKNGGAKFLNVLQGDTHESAEAWYNTMKVYCDPSVYPDRHFDGWAMGGQNMADVHLILHRLVALRYDNLLQSGIHDWMHFLGVSKLEWAVLLTVIQQAVRKYVNPTFTISFDCASPFLATANGQVYYENSLPSEGKWSYRMAPTADDKKYSSDTRKWSSAVIQDQIHRSWTESPVSDLLTMRDICVYKPGDLNKVGKEGRTSWDSFSYALLMGHNVWMHINSVQESNQKFEQGEYPAMLRYTGDYAYFQDIVEAIFAAPDRESANSIIEYYSDYWTQIIGVRGSTGKRAINARTMYNKHIVYDN